MSDNPDRFKWKFNILGTEMGFTVEEAVKLRDELNKRFPPQSPPVSVPSCRVLEGEIKPIDYVVSTSYNSEFVFLPKIKELEKNENE